MKMSPKIENVANWSNDLNLLKFTRSPIFLIFFKWSTFGAVEIIHSIQIHQTNRDVPIWSYFGKIFGASSIYDSYISIFIRARFKGRWPRVETFIDFWKSEMGYLSKWPKIVFLGFLGYFLEKYSYGASGALKCRKYASFSRKVGHPFPIVEPWYYISIISIYLYFYIWAFPFKWGMGE